MKANCPFCSQEVDSLLKITKENTLNESYPTVYLKNKMVFTCQSCSDSFWAEVEKLFQRMVEDGERKRTFKSQQSL